MSYVVTLEQQEQVHLRIESDTLADARRFSDALPSPIGFRLTLTDSMGQVVATRGNSDARPTPPT
jgi:hypothetical protein